MVEMFITLTGANTCAAHLNAFERLVLEGGSEERARKEGTASDDAEDQDEAARYPPGSAPR